MDFYCHAHRHRLVIEVDGGIHDQQQGYDEVRTDWLTQHNYRVLRFTNEAVFNDLEQVIKQILEAVNHR